jgi:outer membrane protein insertion porin family
LDDRATTGRMRMKAAGMFLIALLLASQARAVTIDRIEVSGNVFVSTQQILLIFGVKAGDELREDRISEAVRRLFETKDFADVAVEYRLEGGKAVLMLKVEEYPRVKEVRLQGFNKLKREDIEAKVSLKEGYFARPSLITQDVAAIQSLYAEKGYNRARVDVKRIPLEREHSVIVVYAITEGSKVKVRHIDFLGNGAIETAELRKSMETKESKWWRGGDYKPQVLEEDLKKIKELYENEGYLDAVAKIDRVDETKNGKAVDLYIKIDEGRQYTVGTITWSGNTVVKDDEIKKLVDLEPGEPFSLGKIGGLQAAINSMYWEQGYIRSGIVPERTVHRRRIDLRLGIVESTPSSINEIKLAGNTKTFETVIRRELKVYPGDRFVLGEVRRSLRDIVSLGYFEGFPGVETEPVNDAGDINLLITIKEKTTGNFRMGAGFSQLNSLSGFFGIQENNLLGRGKNVSLDWEFGRYRKNINFSYTEPYFLGTENMITLSLYNWIQDAVRQQYYTDRRKGFSIQLGRPFPWLDYTRFYTSYRFENVSLSDFSSAYPETGVLRLTKWPLNKSSMLFSITRNSTDNPFHPTTGSVASLSAEFCGGPFQGNVKYMRYSGELSWFRNLFWKFTFHMNMESGVIDGYKHPSEVQDFEKFRLGGNRRYALRGYDFYEVVPEGNDPFVGGRFMTTFTHEIIFPFTEQVYALTFFDAGNTWNSFAEADLFHLRRGLGLGVRLEVPGIGTLGFDYGYGFDKVGGPAWEPHFTFGTFF